MSKSEKPTSETSASKAKVRFFLADDFLQQVDGKVSAISLYADDVVILNVAPDTPQPSAETPIALDRLSFMASVTGLSGLHKVSWVFELQTNSAPPTIQPREVNFLPERSASFIAAARPMVVSSFGKKKASLLIDDVQFPFEYELRRSLVKSV